jgi:hypothetical protein
MISSPRRAAAHREAAHIQEERDMQSVDQSSARKFFVPFIVISIVLFSGGAFWFWANRHVRVPDDIMKMDISFAFNGPLNEQERRHFEVLYEKEGHYTNVKPVPGTPYREHLQFRGDIVPLVVKADGELALPLSYVVIDLPFGQGEVRPSKPGDHVGIGSGGLYYVKLRTGERGLVFAIVPWESDDVWLYPSMQEPVVPSSIQEEHVESVEESVRCVEIPSISQLQKIDPDRVRRLAPHVQAFYKGTNGR